MIWVDQGMGSYIRKWVRDCGKFLFFYNIMVCLDVVWVRNGSI